MVCGKSAEIGLFGQPANFDEALDGFELRIAGQNGCVYALTKHAPWYVVPADHKWFTRVVVAAAVIDAMDSVDLHYPKVSKEKLTELEAAKKVLLAGS